METVKNAVYIIVAGLVFSLIMALLILTSR